MCKSCKIAKTCFYFFKLISPRIYRANFAAAEAAARQRCQQKSFTIQKWQIYLGWVPYLANCISVCAYYPAAPGSNPKHIYTFSIYTYLKARVHDDENATFFALG